MKKNPPWNGEELVLGLDLYFSLSYGQMDGRHPKVKALSNLLSLMNEENGFSRTPGSVSLKLANFKRIDPEFKGKGMVGGGKPEEGLWEQFAGSKALLRIAADEIKSNIIARRKKHFAEWLEKYGKTDGSPYQQKTILIYAAQVENGIFKEFPVHQGVNLYEIINLVELVDIEKLLHQGADSKKRRDLRSAFQSYIRFITERYASDVVILTEYDGESRTEGGRKVYISLKAERDIRLRNKAIELHGTSCQVCGFSFGHTYGSWGEGFAEVHHLLPLGTKDLNERITNPKKDLVVLCANCHRMTHRKKGITLTIEELKQKLNPSLRNDR